MWAGAAIAIAVIVAGQALFARRLIRSVKLGDTLSPRPFCPPHRPESIEVIQFGRDPEEDYAESGLPIHLCQVEVRLRPRGRLRLVVTLGDGMRFRDWARRRNIRVIEDADVFRFLGRAE